MLIIKKFSILFLLSAAGTGLAACASTQQSSNASNVRKAMAGESMVGTYVRPEASSLSAAGQSSNASNIRKAAAGDDEMYRVQTRSAPPEMTVSSRPKAVAASQPQSMAMTRAPSKSTSKAKNPVRQMPTTKAARDTGQKVPSDMQSVKIYSWPESSSCEVKKKDGEVLASLDSTPGFVTLKRRNFSGLDVVCQKDGYQTSTQQLRTHTFDKGVGGNIGAIITLAKAAAGTASSFQSSIFVPLKPAAFNSQAEKAEYVAGQRFVTALPHRKKLRKYEKCQAKTKCQKKLAKLNAKIDAALAEDIAWLDDVPVGNSAISPIAYEYEMGQCPTSRSCEDKIPVGCEMIEAAIGNDFKQNYSYDAQKQATVATHYTRLENAQFVYRCPLG